jgi:bifunctional UDP-N-acetylglucosamine pyrophosphorylase/glucosamine-1-phosphate N-acetyltransferase
VGKTQIQQRFGVIILAAGKGTRMESSLAKVLHPVAGRPMLAYVLETTRKLKAAKLAVVIGYQGDDVRAAFSSWKDITWVWQKEMRGTGDAVRCTTKAFSGFSGPVLVLYGDIPGIRVETLRRLSMVHRSSKNAITLLTAELDEPSGYGRVVVDADGTVSRIVEEKDATEEEKEIVEINTGIGMYEPQFLFESVAQLQPTNNQKEYYLTDLVKMARARKLPIGRLRIRDASETLGINDRESLAEVSRFFEDETAARLLRSGVTLEDPASNAIEPSVEVGKDSVIGGQVTLKGATKIGASAIVDGGASMVDCEIGSNVRIGRNVSLREVKVGNGTIIGNHTSVGSFLRSEKKGK